MITTSFPIRAATYPVWCIQGVGATRTRMDCCTRAAHILVPLRHCVIPHTGARGTMHAHGCTWYAPLLSVLDFRHAHIAFTDTLFSRTLALPLSPNAVPPVLPRNAIVGPILGRISRDTGARLPTLSRLEPAELPIGLVNRTLYQPQELRLVPLDST